MQNTESKMKKSFTLLELTIAVAITMVVISSSLIVFVKCITLNESNANLVIAANDAQYVLEGMKSLAFNDIDSLYALPSLTNLDNEAISLTVQEIYSGVKEVTCTVNWREKSRLKNFSLVTRYGR